MAGCLNLVDQDNISRDCVNRWSENVSSVLKSPTAIRRFLEYLNEEDLDGFALLQFWQKSRELIDDYNKRKPHKYEHLKKLEHKKRLHSGREDWEQTIVRKSQEILEFALEYVNFDEELVILDTAVQSNNVLQIITAFNKVKDRAEDKLQKDGYPEFRAHILKNYGFVNEEGMKKNFNKEVPAERHQKSFEYSRCGEGNISPGTLRKWTEKLSNILLSPSAKQKFHEFLQSRGFDQGENLLEFWEKCEHFFNNAEKFNRSSKQGSHKEKASSGASQQRALVQEAKEIVEFADSEINFDPAEMQTLYAAVKTCNMEHILRAVTEAKQRAAEMLEEEGYKEFCDYIKSQRFLKL